MSIVPFVCVFVSFFFFLLFFFYFRSVEWLSYEDHYMILLLSLLMIMIVISGTNRFLVHELWIDERTVTRPGPVFFRNLRVFRIFICVATSLYTNCYIQQRMHFVTASGTRVGCSKSNELPVFRTLEFK